MTEEKKENTENAKPEVKQEPVQAPAEAKPAEQQAKPAAEIKKEAPVVKKEKPANCASCNKSIKKKRWYYRNGKYFCSKRCWMTTLKKEEKTETPAAETK